MQSLNGISKALSTTTTKCKKYEQKKYIKHHHGINIKKASSSSCKLNPYLFLTTKTEQQNTIQLLAKLKTKNILYTHIEIDRYTESQLNQQTNNRPDQTIQAAAKPMDGIDQTAFDP